MRTCARWSCVLWVACASASPVPVEVPDPTDRLDASAPLACESLALALAESQLVANDRTWREVLDALIACGHHRVALALVDEGVVEPSAECALRVVIAERDPVLADAAIAGGWTRHRCVACALLASRRSGDPGMALQWARRAMQEANESQRGATTVRLAVALAGVGQRDAAALACTQALDVEPERARSWHACGEVALGSQDLTLALVRFQRAYTLDPELVDAWLAHGQVALEHRDYEEAARLLGEVLARDPRHYPALVERGIALRALGRLRDSQRHYERAIAVDPDRPEAWFDLGVVLERTDRPGAERAYREFLERAPREMESARVRAERYLQ